MKRLIFASFLLVLLVGVTSLAPAPKYKYSSEEAKLKVTFPAEFKTTEKIKDSYRSKSTQAVYEDMVLFVSYTMHDSEMTDKKELTQVSLDAFTEGLDAEITEQSDWNVKKHEGVKAKLEVSSNGLMGEYRVVIIGQIQYQITAVSAKDTWNDKVAQKFFKSFKVKR